MQHNLNILIKKYFGPTILNKFPLGTRSYLFQRAIDHDKINDRHTTSFQPYNHSTCAHISKQLTEPSTSSFIHYKYIHLVDNSTKKFGRRQKRQRKISSQKADQQKHKKQTSRITNTKPLNHPPLYGNKYNSRISRGLRGGQKSGKACKRESTVVRLSVKGEMAPCRSTIDIVRARDSSESSCITRRTKSREKCRPPSRISNSAPKISHSYEEDETS